MSKASLTKLERKSLELLLSPSNNADEQLRRQIDSAKVRHRRNTGVGMFVEFDVPDELAADNKARIVLSNLSGEMLGLQNGFGGVLYVEKGKLKTLEFFTYDEPWPVDPSNFSLWLEKTPA